MGDHNPDHRGFTDELLNINTPAERQQAIAAMIKRHRGSNPGCADPIDCATATIMAYLLADLFGATNVQLPQRARDEAVALAYRVLAAATINVHVIQLLGDVANIAESASLGRPLGGDVALALRG